IDATDRDSQTYIRTIHGIARMKPPKGRTMFIPEDFRVPDTRGGDVHGADNSGAVHTAAAGEVARPREADQRGATAGGSPGEWAVKARPIPGMEAYMAKDKMGKTMDEFKQGTLHSGSKTGPVVTDPAQAKAIGLSQARKAGQPAPAPKPAAPPKKGKGY